MRFLSFSEFCKEPDGTIFSECGSDDLYRRGEVISYDGGPKDFFMASLLAEEQLPGETPCIDMAKFRWGLFDYDREFLVYDSEDISTIVRALASEELIALEALTIYEWEVETIFMYDEEGVDGWRWSHPSGLEHSEVGSHDETPPLPDGVREYVLERRSERRST